MRNPSEQTDEQLILRYCQSQNRDLFEELVFRYERELFSYLRRYLGDPELAEDAFQGTFLQVHSKCHTFDGSRRFRPWLYTVATNQAIDVQRRNKRHRMVSLDRSGGGGEGDEVASLMHLLESEEPGPQSELDQVERREWLRSALEQLPELLRSTIDLVYYRGLKYREAAQVLDIPVGTVKSRLHAAILKLNELWKAQFPSGR